MKENIEKAISDLSTGKMVIVLDDEDRENEADLIMLAEKVTPEDINFMTREGRGLICVPITNKRAKELDFHPMLLAGNVDYSQELHGCKFTVSVDYRHNITTGISVFDRAKTILAICNQDSLPKDFARPGHIFPLVANDGGIIERPGHTEAGIELAKLAGEFPAAVICEILNEDGGMVRRDDVLDFANKHKLLIIKIKDLVKYVQR